MKNFIYSFFVILGLLVYSLFYSLTPIMANCSQDWENTFCESDTSIPYLGCQHLGGTNYWFYHENLGTNIHGCSGSTPYAIRNRRYTCDPGSTPDACGGSGGSCFTGDTKISTPDGEKEIKDIKEGDVVKSFDPETGEITESTVTNPYSKVSDHIYTITTSDGSVVKTTAEHPFYVGSESDQLPISTGLKIKSFLTRMKIYWVSGIHVLKTSL